MALETPVPEAVAVPCEAAEEMLQVRVSPTFGSVAYRVKEKGVGVPFFDMVTLVDAPSVITGATFTEAVKFKVTGIPVPAKTPVSLATIAPM